MNRLVGLHHRDNLLKELVQDMRYLDMKPWGATFFRIKHAAVRS